MGKALSNDPAYRALREEARRGERGFDEVITPERLKKLRPDLEPLDAARNHDADAAPRSRRNRRANETPRRPESRRRWQKLRMD